MPEFTSVTEKTYAYSLPMRLALAWRVIRGKPVAYRIRFTHGSNGGYIGSIDGSHMVAVDCTVGTIADEPRGDDGKWNYSK